MNFSEEQLSEIDERLKLARDEYIARLERRDIPAKAAYDEYIVNVGGN